MSNDKKLRSDTLYNMEWFVFGFVMYVRVNGCWYRYNSSIVIENFGDGYLLKQPFDNLSLIDDCQTQKLEEAYIKLKADEKTK